LPSILLTGNAGCGSQTGVLGVGALYAPPPIHGHWWYDGIVRAATLGDKRWDRVHMLRQSPALGDCLRYLFEYGYTRSEQAGERCHILEVPEWRSLPLPKEDFWLFDDEFGVVLDYDAQGRWRGAELVTYPPAVNELRRRRDVALALAVPFASWSSGAPLCSCMPAR